MTSPADATTPRVSSPAPLTGSRVRLDVGAVAHGGHCVARIAADSGAPEGHVGRVVFVRHTLPGEQVTAVVTEDEGGSYCRADAVEVHEAAPGRVEPPCPFSGPGRCGGCDWQHADADTQLALKQTVVREALQRFAADATAGLDLDVRVEPLPGGLLHWRTRTTFAVDRSGERPALGLRRHRSHTVQDVTHCPIGVPGVGDAPSTRFDPAAVRADVTGVEYVLGDTGTVTTVVHRPGAAPPATRRGRTDHRGNGRAHRRGRRAPDRTSVVDGPPAVWHAVAGRSFEVSAAGFWQVHPLAATTFAGVLTEGLAPRPGERALDLYAGAGLFTGVLADLVGEAGAVLGLEADTTAVADAAVNLADVPWASVGARRVDPGTVTAAAAELAGSVQGGVDLVVLDPPRTGAGAAVVEAIAATSARAVAYVACDPVALARDLAAFATYGYRAVSLRAFDAFPMTHHVECVAVLTPAGPGS